MCEKRDGVILHFNKMHLVDSNVPMWTIKRKGETYYVNHVEVSPGIGLSTKETPDNPHTKGSLKFKGRLKIETDGMIIVATIY